MNKSRILFILHFPPPVHGSSMMGQYIRNSKLINEDKFDCVYINLSTSVRISDIGKGGIKKIFRFLVIQLRLVYELIFHRPNLCYVALAAKGGPFYKDFTIVQWVRLFGVKRVYHMHNKGVSERESFFPDRLMYRSCFANSSVILLSSHLYSDVSKFVTPQQVFYCPNGIPAIAESVNDNNEDHSVTELLFLSNMIESKGVFVLLDACQILKSQNVNFRCTFVGGWGDITENQFVNYANNLSVSDRVLYAGKHFGRDRNAFFERADIFVFPTYYHYETFGLVNLEAMQYSLPIVSTYEGGIPDVVEHGVTGYLCKQQDAEELALRIRELIEKPELRRKMGAAGRIRYEKHFTLQHFENCMVQILDDILNTIK